MGEILMSNLEKINIYVPVNVGKMLDYDARMFEILKKDAQTINMNRFLSLIICGYYNTYATDCLDLRAKILMELESLSTNVGDKINVAENILRNVILPQIPAKRNKQSMRLSLKPTKDTESLILKIMNDIGDKEFISQFFCRLLMSYCEKPFYIREQLVFKENFDFLADACTRQTPLAISTVWDKTKVHEIIPYKLTVGKEEMFNYLLCGEYNSVERIVTARTYRLNRIGKINYNHSSEKLSADVIHNLESMSLYGPQYIIRDNEEACVRLSDIGVDMFRKLYHGRPDVDRIEQTDDNCYNYYFKCSKDQLFFYFRKFSYSEAEIMYPQELRSRIIEFHRASLNGYI